MAFLTLENLITADGEVNRVAYAHMVRRRAMNEYGGLSPQAIRRAVAHYVEIIPILMAHKLAQQSREMA